MSPDKHKTSNAKRFLILGILVLILVGIFVPNVSYALDGCTSAGPACTSGGQPGTCADGVSMGIGFYCQVTNRSLTTSGPGGSKPDPLANWIFDGFAKGVGQALMSISSFVLILSGAIFDWILNFTIVEMAKNIGGTTGVGGSISAAWGTLRDIANMAFIFVLLYAAFRAMFLAEGNFGKTVKNIIIVALLINFSLFFSKVVIDASNVVAIGFYNSITSSNNASLTGSNVLGATSVSKFRGISGGYMNMLGMQTLFSSNILKSKDSAGNPIDLSPSKVLIIGIMSAVFMLIVAVILFISGIMFAARFIILIFIMILSPLALIAYIIPGAKGQFEKWKSALIDQSFFAPLFFALTWVVFKLGNSLIATIETQSKLKLQTTDFTNIFNEPSSAVAILINYVLIIGFSIAALIFSKQMASKTAGFSAITNAMGANKVAGVVGGATLGGASALSRRTIGAGASRFAQSDWLNRTAANSWLGQKLKEGTEGVAKSSFDVRQTKGIGGALQKTQLGSFGAGKAGGFDATLATKTAKREKVAAGLRGDAAKEAYAARISRGPFTRGGSSNSGNTLFGTMGRHNRVVASKILNNQLTPFENTQQTLQNREAQLSQQVASMTAELGNLTTAPARVAILSAPAIDPVTGAANRGSVAYVQASLTTTQTQLTNATAEVTRIRGLITANGLTNTTPTGTITNPVTGVVRQRRADEQNY